MFVRKGTGAPWRERGGLVSRILPQEWGMTGAWLTATWVEVAPGPRQRRRDHAAERACAVLGGRGKTRAGEEERRGEGEGLARVPPGALGGIEGASEGALVYVSAAILALDAGAAYDTGRLRERPGDREGGGRAHG